MVRDPTSPGDPTSQVVPGSGGRAANVTVKLIGVALIATSLVLGDADRFRDKAMGARAIAYPLMCAVPAGIWLIARRLRPATPRRPYPHLVDALVTLPFLLDLGGNALDLFDTISWWDDLLHFLNWFLLGSALAAVLAADARRKRWEVAWMVAGAGAVAAIVWELAEYQSFVLKVEAVGIYRDTVGDLVLGCSGAALAGVLAAARPAWARRPGRP